MDQSALDTAQTGPERSKYNHMPLMRIDKEFRNMGASAFQVMPPYALNQVSVDSNDRLPAVGNPPPPTDDPDFVIITAGSVRKAQRLCGDSQTQSPTLNEIASFWKRRRPSNVAQPDRKYTFRPSKPLKNSDLVSSDIWQIILGYCEPRFLIEAKTINSSFYRLLYDRAGIWRKSRQNYYGPDMPDCPAGLTEQQYVDLLAGRGCQNKTCHKDNTARVYWPFQVRLCAECFKQKTMRADELPQHRRHFLIQGHNQDPSIAEKPLWELLPLARSDGRRYMRPRSVDIATNTWSPGNNSRQYVFLKVAYQKLEAAYLDFFSSKRERNDMREWTDRVHESTMLFMLEVAKIEAWYKRQIPADTDLRQMRIEFFETRAAELSPPMSPEILWRMAAFRRILKVQTAPTERSWKTLKDKILPYRFQAERLEKFKSDMAFNKVPNPPDSIRVFQRLHAHRSSRKDAKEEQLFVLTLGRTELARCTASGAADTDLLLLCLKNVFDAYEQLNMDHRPTGMNFDGKIGKYRLSLDDARMIVEDVIGEEIPRESHRGRAIFQSLRCRGCRRSDFIKTWSFVEAFEHILATHAQEVGDGLEFWKFAIPYSCEYETWAPGREVDKSVYRFPWYTVEWPTCLPLVPSHQDTWTLNPWYPDAREPFVQLQVPATISAFEGRVPRQTHIPHADFVGNLVFAAKTLNGVWLDAPCQMKIALKYTLDLLAATGMTEPPLAALMSCTEEVSHVNPTIDLRFRCGLCAGDGRAQRSTRQGKFKISIENLVSHWEEKHKDSGQPWSHGLMKLPTESEVMGQILEADKKLREEQEATREREAELSTDLKKRPRLKRNVVMNTPSARDVFNELFIRQAENELKI